ncbi:MAG: pilus assembly protein [Pirellulaceae bacterium]|nr:pilus assembly protein [Planctomycetales bacterium]
MSDPAITSVLDTDLAHGQRQATLRRGCETSRLGEHRALPSRTGRGRGSNRHQGKDERRGVVAVEMAFVMPLFLILLVGLMQLTMLFDSYNQFSMAAREGGRLALFEREGMVPEGSTTNQIVDREIKRYLEAHGYETEHIDVEICFPGEPNRPFDLDAQDNALQLFEVRVGYKLDQLLFTPPPGAEDQNLLAAMVFRNSPGRLVQ